jgi:ABC-2 type transport system ATP-binding protein
MLELANISKSFANSPALEALSFLANPGEIVAVIGPNGAGKSTLFNILAGVLKESSGLCLLNEKPLSETPVSDIGFLPEQPYFYASFSPLQTIEFEKTMRSIADAQSNQEELCKVFDVSGFLRTKMGQLSQGMAKRVALVCAFLGNPQLIVLDEPLNGLDIQSVFSLKEQLLVQKAKGAHMLISSHVLTFLDGLVDKTVFLDKGKVVFESTEQDGTVEDAYRQLFL